LGLIVDKRCVALEESSMADVPITPFLRKLQEMDPAFAEPVLKVRELATYTPGALEVKTKLLIAFALDVAHGEASGARILAKRARENGATGEEIVDVVRVLYSTGGLQCLSIAMEALSD
jgi:alkylhydroperoxidase/carboxymuconolactone decarboxylase family protein YurZ